MENSNREKSDTQINYIIREITGEEERTSQLLCIYNGILIYTTLILVISFYREN